MDSRTWQAWQEQRATFLSDPYGWLSVTSFTWLTDKPQQLPDFPGNWHVEYEDGDKIIAHGIFEPNTVEYCGKPVTEVTIVCLNEEDDVDLRTIAAEGEAKIAEVGMRGGRYRIRVRDPKSQNLANFTQVPIYDYDDESRVLAYFRPFSHVRKVGIDTFLDDVSSTAELVGVIDFMYKGVPTSLVVQGNPEGTLTAVFGDGTNWKETSGWRFVNFAGPDSPDNTITEELVRIATESDSKEKWESGKSGVVDNNFDFEVSETDVDDEYKEVPLEKDITRENLEKYANVVVDFNTAQNFMMEFTDFTTCPKPPAGNTISAHVRAGEKKYR